MLVAVLHSLLFDVTPHPFVSYSRDFTPILYFQPSSSQTDTWHFHFNLSRPFFHSFTASATILRGHFLPTGVFYLKALPFPTFLPQPAFLKVSLRAGSSSLKFAELHADSRNTGPVYLFIWFTAIHNLDIQKNSYLNRTKYYYELLVVKSLVYLLLARSELFSLVQSHM